MSKFGEQTGQYDYLKDLSIEDLEVLLQKTGEADFEGDEEYVDAIVEEIVQREREHPTGRIPNVDQAWLEFQLVYNTPERKQYIQFLEKELRLKEK